MIIAENLSRDYGPTSSEAASKPWRRHGVVHALQSVSFRVEDGETVALLGPNGAGKSTLLLILAGVLQASGGRAQVAGINIPGGEAKLGTRVGFVPQGESLYPELTVRENVVFFGRIHGVPREAIAARADALLQEMGIADRAHTRAAALSGGLRQRAAVAASLAHDPAVVLLDEPATGLDPPARVRLARSLRALGAGIASGSSREDASERVRKRSVLFSTHNIEDAAALANRVFFIVRGRIAATLPGGDAPRLADTFRRLEAMGATPEVPR